MSPAHPLANPGLILVPPSSLKTEAPLPKQRHITVSSRSIPNGSGYRHVPKIILSGLHLEKIGLTIGSKVTVIEKAGELILRLAGPSAHRDPNETADDRRYARKVKRITDYQQTTKFPLSDAIISHYLSGDLSLHIGELVSRVIDGQVPESHQTEVHKFLMGKRNPLSEQVMANFYLRLIDEFPKPKRKSTTKKKKPSALPAENSRTDKTSRIPDPASPKNKLKQQPAEM